MSLSRLPRPGEWAPEAPSDYHDDGAYDYVVSTEPNGNGLTATPLEVVKLGNMMRAGVQAPTMVDPWLYAGALISLQSEPGVGKSWIAPWLALRQMRAGRSVAYLDEEGGPELVTERLLLLGADPDMIDEQFCYLPFPQRTWGILDIAALVEVLEPYHQRFPLAAGYLDSLPDFLAAAGADEDNSGAITGFTAKLLPIFRNYGAALVVLDHLKKPDKDGKKSRYARGSGAKLAKVAAAILLEIDKEFDATTSGSLKVWKTKDRRGRLPLPALSRSPLILDVAVDPGASVRISEHAAPAKPSEAWDGPSECMAAVIGVLKRSPSTEFTGNQLHKLAVGELGTGFRKPTVTEAISHLAKKGDAMVRSGPHNSLLYRWAGGVDSVAVELDEDF